MTTWTAEPCGCTQDVAMGQKRERVCKHGYFFQREKSAATSSDAKESKPRRRQSGLKRGRGFAASPAQQAKVKDSPCIVCGLDRFEAEVHAAHVWPRTYTPCDCADGVVPLCAEHHALYDQPDHPLDLLSYLVRGYRAEFCHAFIEHDIPMSELLRRVTGTPWRPLAKPEGVAA